MNLKILLIVVFALFFTGVSFAHEGHKKNKSDSTKIEENTEQAQHMQQPALTKEYNMEEAQAHQESIMGKANLSDFPTLHPLIVHFPIVLLLLAVLSQFTGLFVLKEQLSWATLVFVFLGFIGALVATRFVHPHTGELPQIPAWLLQQHEKYADLTLYTSLGGLGLKIFSHFFLKRKIWAESLVFITLALSAWFITSASHFGAQLTHIEGIGPQGHYLETHSSEQEHDH